MAMSRPATRPAPIIPDHELLERIGRGSYGEVWLARNRTTHTLRAVKVVFRDEFEDERPYRREFDGLLKFEPISRSHPSQLAIPHSAFRAPSFYAPHTLRSELKSRGRLPVSEVIELGRALTTALGHLHAQGLVHRDIKPSNVVYVGGVPKLADIGLVTDASDTCSIVGTEDLSRPRAQARRRLICTRWARCCMRRRRVGTGGTIHRCRWNCGKRLRRVGGSN